MSQAKTLSPGKGIRSSVVINLIRTLTMTILSFITFPYVTRALGDEVFGLYTWANAFVYYFLILAKISIPNIAIRECAKVKDDKEALSRKAQQFFLIQGITTLLSFGLLCSLAWTVPSLRENNTLIFILSINFLAGVFSFEWIYIALEKHFYITFRSIMLIALSAMMTFLFITPTAYPLNEVYVYALITISVTVFTSIINCILLPRHISFKVKGPYEWKGLFKPLFVIFLISLALTLYNQTDEFILGFLDPSKAAVGAYSVGVKGIDIVITLITSLYAVFMPRATYYYEKEDKRFYRNLLRYSFNIVFFISIPAIATMAAMSGTITSLISGSSASGQYRYADVVLMILSVMMLTYSIGDSIYTEILLPQKKEKVYLIAMAVGGACNVGLSFLLAFTAFKNDPILGVAIATGSTDVVLAIFLMLKTKEYSLEAIWNLNNLKIFISGVLIFLFCFFVCPLIIKALPFNGDSFVYAELIGLVATTLAAGIIYCGTLLLFKEKLVSSFTPKRRKEREAEENA